MKSLKSLIITTSNDRFSNAFNKTGLWMEDIAGPYYVLKDGGGQITIASPGGGQIAVDPNSLLTAAITQNTIRFERDARAMYQLDHSITLNEVKPQDYDLVFIAGGYKAMWEFADNARLKQIIRHFNLLYRPVGLVGHAVVALTTLKTDNGEAFVKDKKLTAFSNSEEVSIGLNELVPFSLQSRLIGLGALYSQGPDLTSYVVADENIITGQNPASAVEVAKQTLSLAYSQCRNEMSYKNPSS